MWPGLASAAQLKPRPYRSPKQPGPGRDEEWKSAGGAAQLKRKILTGVHNWEGGVMVIVIPNQRVGYILTF